MNFFENNDFISPYGLRLSDLNVDEAYFNLTSIFYDDLQIYSLSSDCKKCPFTYTTSLNATKIISVSTKYHTTWRFYRKSQSIPIKSINDKEFLLCEINENIGEFGIYDVIIQKKHCEFLTQKEPVNIYLSLCGAFILLLLLYLFIKLGWSLGEKYLSKEKESTQEIDVDQNNSSARKNMNRIRSIDTFRGIALCLMVFVNDGGGKYWFFEHSTWNGLYFTDLLYPWFLWIIGMCIALSQTSNKKKAIRKKVIFWTTLQRSFILFIIGLALNTLGVGPVDLQLLRIPGILQRIALSYGITSIIAMLVHDIKMNILDVIKYVIILLPQWFLHLTTVGVHIYLTFYLPVPNCPTGFLEAGGIQNDGNYENCTGGATGYIDKVLLGENRLWQIAPVRSTYHTPPFDPENILGSLTSIFGTFLGVQAGYILVVHQKPLTRIRHFIIWGFLLLIPGFGLHFFDVIPINKNLWSLSFVFVTSGLAYLFFGFLYYIIDYLRLWNGSPFIYPGMNSILVYVGHEICFQLFPWHWKFSTMNTHFKHLIENIWGVILWIVITFYLHEKKIFIVV